MKSTGIFFFWILKPNVNEFLVKKKSLNICTNACKYCSQTNTCIWHIWISSPNAAKNYISFSCVIFKSQKRNKTKRKKFWTTKQKYQNKVHWLIIRWWKIQLYKTKQKKIPTTNQWSVIVSNTHTQGSIFFLIENKQQEPCVCVVGCFSKKKKMIDNIDQFYSDIYRDLDLSTINESITFMAKKSWNFSHF